MQRIFRVYTIDLVNCVDCLLKNNEPKYMRLVQEHLQRLGSYAPPQLIPMSLASCQDDMKILLEDIELRQSKGVESFWGPSGSTPGRVPAEFLKHARWMVNLPANYQVSAKSKNTIRVKDPFLNPPSLPVDANGRLTEEAMLKVYHGEVKCDPAAVVYNGDYMRRALETNEIEILVKIFIDLSEKVHERTGYKLDFRFFADWRNLLVSLLGLSIGMILLKFLLF
jgi:hypothetical protein